MRCRDCFYCKEDAVTSCFSGCMYWVNFCDYQEYKLRLIDVEVERQCKDFKPLEEVRDGVPTTERV